MPEDTRDALELVRDLILGRPVGDPALLTDRARSQRAELVTRFQQTCGPVMAKGVEDTAAYRWVRLVSLNEVGGDPSRIGLPPEELHTFAAQQLQTHPTAMTTLSTHDTKRSEDVRARLAVASELGADWTELIRALHAASSGYRAAEVDGRVELLIWQTLIGTFPITRQRLVPYVEKAIREAKLHTTWTTPEPAYEDAVRDFVERALQDEVVLDLVRAWGRSTAEAVAATTLGQKLLQLVLPGVPDVYQGCESLSLTLVDPDNRQPVDHEATAPRTSPTLEADLDLRLARSRPGQAAGDRTGAAAAP